PRGASGRTTGCTPVSRPVESRDRTPWAVRGARTTGRRPVAVRSCGVSGRVDAVAARSRSERRLGSRVPPAGVGRAVDSAEGADAPAGPARADGAEAPVGAARLGGPDVAAPAASSDPAAGGVVPVGRAGPAATAGAWSGAEAEPARSAASDAGPPPALSSAARR